MAVYIADMLLWLSEGSPVRAVAEYTNRATPHVEHPDLGSMIVRFDDDTVGTATLTTSTDCREPWGNWEVEVVGDGGVLRTAHNGYEGIQWSAGDVDERTATAFGRTTSPVLDRALGMFVDSVLGRSEPTPSADEVVAAHVLCDVWARSADQCRLVRVDDRSA
jgi:predicted dehydrogenase